MLPNDLYTIRAYKENDRNFILASWLNGLRFGNSWYTLIDKTAYFKVYQEALKKILDSKNTKIKISCLKDSEDVILGYAVTNVEETVLYWTFVKEKWRGIGIMNSMVSPSINTINHVTKAAITLMKKKNWKFNPFSL